MKILFSGSFKFFDETKKMKKRLEKVGFECILPKFSLGDFSAQKIEEVKDKKKRNGFKKGEFEKIIKVEKWYFDQLKKCDLMIVFDLKGYIGLSVAAEIGAAHILKKPVFFLEKPTDDGIFALMKFSKNFKIVPRKNLIRELKKFKNETSVKKREIAN